MKALARPPANSLPITQHRELLDVYSCLVGNWQAGWADVGCMEAFDCQCWDGNESICPGLTDGVALGSNPLGLPV